MNTSVAFWLAVGLFATVVAAACSQAEPNGVTSLDFVVCGRSENWVRPSVEEQRAKIWSLPRHQGKDEARLREILEDTQVFEWLGGNSELFDRGGLNGLWTADDWMNMADCGEGYDAFRGIWQHLYLLNYRAVDLQLFRSTFELRVEQTERGYEHVAFKNPLYREGGVPVPYRVRVVLSDGQELYMHESCVPRDKGPRCGQPTEESVSRPGR